MKKLNKFKVALAIITIPELIVMFTVNHQMLENDINLWRLYILVIMCVIFNITYICVKK
jgi:hypothetical protein